MTDLIINCICGAILGWTTVTWFWICKTSHPATIIEFKKDAQLTEEDWDKLRKILKS